jgi:lipoprotein-anchoring transpeptidase ErfK/SrfK
MSNNKQTSNLPIHCAAAALLLLGTALWSTTAHSQALAWNSETNASLVLPFPAAPAVTQDRGPIDEGGDAIVEKAPAGFNRQIVNYTTAEAPGTIVVDTPNTYLYFVLGGGKAVRYGIGVGREGFTWAGVKTIERKSEWPDWIPPSDMLARQPYLPRFMAGGPGTPLGARAMYLGGTVYRIHGTNAPDTIGKQVSSGCIRMVNDDVIDLYGRTHVGTKVVVLPMSQHHIAQPKRPVPAPVHATARGFRASGIY